MTIMCGYGDDDDVTRDEEINVRAPVPDVTVQALQWGKLHVYLARAKKRRGKREREG